MKYVVAIIFAMLLTVGSVAWGLTDPTIFIAGLALIPPMLQFIPWQLAAPPEPEVRDYQGTGVGFVRDDEDHEFADSDFDPEEDPDEKNKAKR